jgi:hypothetical protein
MVWDGGLVPKPVTLVLYTLVSMIKRSNTIKPAYNIIKGALRFCMSYVMLYYMLCYVLYVMLYDMLH